MAHKTAKGNGGDGRAGEGELEEYFSSPALPLSRSLFDSGFEVK
jgi:hypothetical protein